MRRHLAELGPLRVSTRYQPPPSLQWDEARFRGDAYGAYSYAVYVAQVAVDLTTYEARCEDFVALQEVGRVIHPVLAAGQIEGGVAQGVGWALYEDVAWQDGRMANNRMTDYIIPTAADIPPIRVFFEDGHYPHGAFGAKGIGELPMDGPAPAILNAIHDAIGVSITQVPATPEVLFAALAAPQPVPPPQEGRPWRLSCASTSTVAPSRSAAPPMRRLLDVLREDLRLTGTKEGCGEGECGACAVRINGELANSCLVPVAQVVGASVQTIEGVADGETLHAVQQAFLDHGGAQCGICTPGMILAAIELLERTPNPSEAEVRTALAGNLCRCTGYMKIFSAVLAACAARPHVEVQP